MCCFVVVTRWRVRRNRPLDLSTFVLFLISVFPLVLCRHSSPAHKPRERDQPSPSPSPSRSHSSRASHTQATQPDRLHRTERHRDRTQRKERPESTQQQKQADESYGSTQEVVSRLLTTTGAVATHSFKDAFRNSAVEQKISKSASLLHSPSKVMFKSTEDGDGDRKRDRDSEFRVPGFGLPRQTTLNFQPERDRSEKSTRKDDKADKAERVSADKHKDKHVARKLSMSDSPTKSSKSKSASAKTSSEAHAMDIDDELEFVEPVAKPRNSNEHTHTAKSESEQRKESVSSSRSPSKSKSNGPGSGSRTASQPGSIQSQSSTSADKAQSFAAMAAKNGMSVVDFANLIKRSSKEEVAKLLRGSH